MATSTSHSRRRRSDQVASRLMHVHARHHVAEAAHGADEVGAELLAQAVDVDLHRVAADVVLPAVQLLFELGRENTTPGRCSIGSSTPIRAATGQRLAVPQKASRVAGLSSTPLWLISGSPRPALRRSSARTRASSSSVS
jgi:hypothetical protein